MTENQKNILVRLTEKTYWLREDAESKCAGIYSTGEELIRGFATMSSNGLLCLNKDGHSKIIGLWVTDAGIIIAKRFLEVKKISPSNPCRVEMKVCYLSYKCNATKFAQ